MEKFLSVNGSKVAFLLLMTSGIYLWFGPKPTGCFLILVALVQILPDKKEPK